MTSPDFPEGVRWQSRKIEVQIVGDASALQRAFGQATASTQGFGDKLQKAGMTALRGITRTRHPWAATASRSTFGTSRPKTASTGFPSRRLTY